MSLDAQTSEKLPNLRHPSDKDLSPRFESFLPFVHVSGEQTKQKFIEVLRELFKETGNDWRPGCCYSTEYLTRTVERLQLNKKLSGIKFTPMSWLDAHFFLTAKINEESKPLIIDPFGVPPSGAPEYMWMKDMGIITPYFGDLEFAPERHKRVYSTAESIENKGFHHFHP